MSSHRERCRKRKEPDHIAPVRSQRERSVQVKQILFSREGTISKGRWRTERERKGKNVRCPGRIRVDCLKATMRPGNAWHNLVVVARAGVSYHGIFPPDGEANARQMNSPHKVVLELLHGHSHCTRPLRMHRGQGAPYTVKHLHAAHTRCILEWGERELWVMS